MRMKQITAATMQEAMLMAKRELGDEAILLETRKLAGNKGVTVVFALDEVENDLPAAAAQTASFPESQRDSRGIQEKISLDSPRIFLKKNSGNDVLHDSHAASVKKHPAIEIIAEALKSHATPPTLMRKLLESVETMRIPAGAPMDAAETLLEQALAQFITFNPITLGAYPTRAMMFIGPHGAGKTSVLAKLATQLTLAKQRVVLISTDTEHMGAAETMQGLSDILTCELHIINKRALLRELVKQTLGQAWILIDSFGVNIYEFAQMKALGELAGLQGIEPILTFPAEMDAEEAIEMAGVFSFLPIDRIIVTRLDASRRLSSMFGALHAGGYALANISTSASPSEAAQELNAPTLAHLILRRARERLSH